MGELYELQRSFTEHLRNPDQVPVPDGLDERRMGIYSELIFNNLSALLSDFFPVLKSIISTDAWDSMIRDFFISHESQTPYFPQIAGEFVEYLAEGQLGEALPGFTTELAHYEWLELAVYTLEDSPPEKMIEPDELAHTPLALSPLALPLVYQYPVHQISPDFVPEGPSDTPHFLLMIRDEEENVRFFELQPLAFEMLHQIDENPGLIAEKWLSDLADQIDGVKKDDFVRNGIDLLQSFNEHLVLMSH